MNASVHMTLAYVFADLGTDRRLHDIVDLEAVIAILLMKLASAALIPGLVWLLAIVGNPVGWAFLPISFMTFVAPLFTAFIMGCSSIFRSFVETICQFWLDTGSRRSSSYSTVVCVGKCNSFLSLFSSLLFSPLLPSSPPPLPSPPACPPQMRFGTLRNNRSDKVDDVSEARGTTAGPRCGRRRNGKCFFYSILITLAGRSRSLPRSRSSPTPMPDPSPGPIPPPARLIPPPIPIPLASASRSSTAASLLLLTERSLAASSVRSSPKRWR